MAAAAVAPAKKSGPVRHYDNWDRYINMVLAKAFPSFNYQISTASLILLNDVVKNVLDRMHCVMHSLMDSDNKRTLQVNAVMSAIRLSLPGELGKHAYQEATNAVIRFTQQKQGSRADKKSRTERAGLVLSVSRVDAALAKLHFNRISPKASVAAAAALEYVLAEILTLAANVTRDSKQMRISTRNINLAIQYDEELSALFKGHVFGAGGVKPNVHPMLEKRK